MAILKKAWSTCRPEQVAAAALPLYDAPSADETQRRQVEAWVAEAVRKRPDAVRARSKLGVIWIRQGRFDEAEAIVSPASAERSRRCDALNSLAWLLALRDESKTAGGPGAINRAIEVQGPVPSLVDTRAVVLIRAGQARQGHRGSPALAKTSNRRKRGSARVTSRGLPRQRGRE